MLRELKKGSACWLIMALILVFAFCDCSSDRRDNEGIESGSELQRGWQEYSSGNYSSAILAFEKAINANPTPEIMGDAYNGLGWAYSNISKDPGVNKVNISSALGKFRNALEYDGGNSDALVGMASILLVGYSNDDNLNDAIGAIDGALQGNTAYLYRHDYDSKADLYALKALCYYYLGDLNGAKREVDKCLEIEKGNNTAISLGILLN